MARISLYPRATQRQPKLGRRLEGINGRRFFRASTKNFLLLQILFLGLFSYIFGSLFQQGERTHNLIIGFVDYDGGAIGAAVRQAYGSLQSNAFPSLVERPTSDFPSPADLESIVCSADYWAALYVLPGASDRLHDALRAETQSFDRRDVMAFFWNQARYPTVVDPAIASNLVALSNAARIAYSSPNGTGQVESILSTDNITFEAISILANPWELVSIDIQPTTQGSRAIYNTVAIILIMMQEFFYLGILNGLSHNFQVYTKLRPTRIILFRNLNSLAYCLIGSLCVAGTIWAFRSGWAVGGGQFVLTWMALWLFAHINFQTLDVFSVWLPVPYVPMALVIWVVLNVTSAISPFELSAGWYRIGYMFPAHETYQVLIDIWSRGCNPRLHYALPVLFAWEIVASVLAVLGVYRRSHYAALAEEAAQKQFSERLDAAVEFQRKREREIKQAETKVEERDGDDGDIESEAVERGSEEDRLRRELTVAMDKEDEQIRKEQTRENRARPGFGLSFDLPFNEDGDSDDV